MFAQIKRRTLAVAVAALLVGMTANARADFVVAPNANANVEGDGNNGFPFNIQDFGISTMRYQQVYDSSQFSSLGGPKLITEIIFRPDAQSGQAFSSTLSSIQIDLSTTSAAPGGLSNTFANNVGADDKVVYGLGSLSLSSAFTGPANGPKDFDIVINLTTPFLYDPSKGNLLMDVRNFGGGSTTQFDAVQNSSVTDRVWNTNVNSGTATSSGLYELVTEFAYTSSAVPEPATLVPAISGVLFVLGCVLRRRGRVANA